MDLRLGGGARVGVLGGRLLPRVKGNMNLLFESLVDIRSLHIYIHIYIAFSSRLNKSNQQG